MKKIYALLGATLMAGSAMAALPKVDANKLQQFRNQELTASPEALAQLNADMAYAAYQLENGISDPNDLVRKSWTDGNGKTWTLTAKWTGNFGDMFSTDFAKLFDKVLVTCQTYDATTKSGTRIQHLLWWPLQKAIGSLASDSASLMNTVKTKYGDKYDPDKIVPLEFMNTNYNFFTDFDMAFCCPAASANQNSFYLYYTKNSESVYCWDILNSSTMQSATAYYYQYMGYGGNYIQTNGTAVWYGPTQYTTLYFSNYDGETSSINAAFKGGFTKTPNGAAAYSYDMNYAGEGEFLGLTSGQKRGYTLGELHIVNMGEVSSDNWNYYDVDFGPLTRYYMLFCDPTLTFQASEFTATSIPSKPYTKGSDYTVNWGGGALYSAANSTAPTGIWKEFYVEYDKDYLTTNAPTAGSCVQYMLNMNQTYFPWSGVDGLYTYINNDMTNFIAKNLPKDQYAPFVMNGTTAGFGIQGIDFYNTTVIIDFKGNATYHYDSKDYSKTQTLATVGDLAPDANWANGDGVNSAIADAANATINVVNGKVVITLDEAANVAVYTTAGVLVNNFKAAAGTTNVELGNGLYIVKAGNKVAKVIL